MIPLIHVGFPPIVALIPGRPVMPPLALEPIVDELVDVEDAYRRARASGWSAELAAVVAAGEMGLPVFDEAGDPIRWTIRNLRHFVFLKWLAEHDRLAGDLPDGWRAEA